MKTRKPLLLLSGIYLDSDKINQGKDLEWRLSDFLSKDWR